ncbi:MAG: sigma-54 dependent transcriptional regulator [Calditrichia bacterium]
MKFQLLIIDDEQLVCNSTGRILEDPEIEVYTATTFEAAQEILKQIHIDLILLDYKLGGVDGLTVLRNIKENYPETAVIMVTAFGNIEIAVEAMKIGAYDFIQKKEEPTFIRFTVKRALDNLRLKKEVEELRRAFQENQKLPQIISQSPKMKELLARAEEYSKSDSTILLTGETGTGKNLLARYIHLKSSRFDAPFIFINCAAIPRELIESELFGYERGAFTGAYQKGKKGLIEQAHRGTLFLDEIGELNLDLQSKLLHVLEHNEFFRVGSVNSTRVNVRFIASTNSDLQEKVKQKKFRMDLFYRLNVANLTIPPLRERKEDILPMAKYFIAEFNTKFNKSVHTLTPEVEAFLLSAPWPGNVRELRNFIERAMLLKKDSVLRIEDFKGPDFNGTASPTGAFDSPNLFSFSLNPRNGENVLHTAQRHLILQALQITNQNRSQAAKLLGIPRTTLNFYLQKFKLSG